MSTSRCDIPHPLKREGTYQWQRMQAGLKDGFYKPDDRSIEQLVMQVAEYAALVKYYDTTLNEWGRWTEFYDYIYDYQNHKLRFANIDSLLLKGDIPPHLGLLLGFLKTFQATRDGYNNFTNRHLNFYYTDVLQLTRKDAVPDNIAVLFEPEKNTVQARVEAGRELNAGKDAIGKNLVYTTTREIIVNQAIVTQKKTIFADQQSNGLINGLYIAKDAATENKFVQNNISSWRAFGSTENSTADIGFAISSPMLLAKEGRRRFSIEIAGGQAMPRASLTAFYTGPDGWVEADVDLAPGINYSSSAASKNYLLVKINESLPAIAPYNEKTHKSNYPCIYPVLKLLIKDDAGFPAAFDFFSGLKMSALKKIVMNVEGAKSFTITGDNGKLNPLQAFKPFGNAPSKNKSFFTIGSSEAFNKYLKTFHLAANWKGAPGNMTKYYSAYQTYIQTAKDPSIGPETVINFNKQWASFNQGNVPGKMELLSGGKWVSVSEDFPKKYTKVNKEKTYNTFHTDAVIKSDYDINNSSEFSESSRWGFAKVTLQYDFGHQIFPNVLTYTITSNAKPGATVTPAPPQPYTPEFNSLHLDYVLEDNIDLAASPVQQHQFLQLHPFGFNKITSLQDPLIVPDYNDNGQLYIGIDNCPVAQTINLYIPRLDGTEAIDALINEKAVWYYLAGSSWLKFDVDQITVNSTADFTEGGFVSFAIPPGALAPNTLMGENLVWLKIVSASSATAYPSVIDINTNAAEAVFNDRGNDPYHLQSPLPAGTVTKPVIKIAGVKSISQPSASYGGAMAEQDEHFYTRVSERLRHKNRAWSIWDYEHLVLEKFPSIYKLKCISHALQYDMYAPGNVLCVALPATVNIAEKDLLQPRISKGILTEAAEYVSSLMSTFAKVQFINPVYEPITIKCSVQIKEGFDENFYGKQLNADLQQYISPWLLNNTISPSFAGKIYASGIINFIEERPYIDYLTNFEAFKLAEGTTVHWTESTSGSSEDVILTSAAQHIIDTTAIC